MSMGHPRQVAKPRVNRFTLVSSALSSAGIQVTVAWTIRGRPLAIPFYPSDIIKDGIFSPLTCWGNQGTQQQIPIKCLSADPSDVIVKDCPGGLPHGDDRVGGT